MLTSISSAIFTWMLKDYLLLGVVLQEFRGTHLDNLKPSVFCLLNLKVVLYLFHTRAVLFVMKSPQKIIKFYPFPMKDTSWKVATDEITISLNLSIFLEFIPVAEMYRIARKVMTSMSSHDGYSRSALLHAYPNREKLTTFSSWRVFLEGSGGGRFWSWHNTWYIVVVWG